MNQIVLIPNSVALNLYWDFPQFCWPPLVQAKKEPKQVQALSKDTWMDRGNATPAVGMGDPGLRAGENGMVYTNMVSSPPFSARPRSTERTVWR